MYSFNIVQINKTGLKDDFVGKWIYKNSNENFQINVIKEGTIFKGYYSLIVDDGEKMDIRIDNSTYNINVGTYSNNTLQIILNSSYSNAKYNAKLILTDSNILTFELGSVIVEDINFFPRKKIEMTKQQTFIISQNENNFTGDWKWEKNNTESTFNIKLTQISNSIKGQHCITALKGRKSDCSGIIDENEVTIEGVNNENIAEIRFKSNFSNDWGKAKLTILDNGRLKWEVIQKIDGENYFPDIAILIDNSFQNPHESPEDKY